MRRGRPPPSKGPTPEVSASPKVRPVSTDPFAALDHPSLKLAGQQDELSARFPSVEQFSLLHDSGGKFEFKSMESPTAFVATTSPPAKDLSTRVMERLADEAFVAPSPPAQKMTETPRIQQGSIIQPQPQRPSMVSTGTMTSPHHSPSPSPPDKDKSLARATEMSFSHSRPQSRALEHHTYQQYQSAAPVSSHTVSNNTAYAQRPSYLEANRSSSHITPRATVSSRPSLESHRPSSTSEMFTSSSSSRVKTSGKSRPSSVYIESNLDFLRDLDSTPRDGPATPPGVSGRHVHEDITGQSIGSQRSDHIESNVDFLKAMESESDAAKGYKGERKVSPHAHHSLGKHAKRASMPSISLHGTKTLLAGKFGEAFRRFEGGNQNLSVSESQRTPSPGNGSDRFSISVSGNGLSGAAETEMQHVKANVDVNVVEEDTPEARREMEARLLAQEEERVAAAAAKYKAEVASRSRGGAPGETSYRPSSGSIGKSSSIQNKVKALLSENRAPTPRTAEGYGQYTDKVVHSPQLDVKVPQPPLRQSTLAAASPTLTGRPPNPPPKPQKLRTLVAESEPSGRPTTANAAHESSERPKQMPSNDVDVDSPLIGDPEEWQRNFALRYPSLNGLEMVETVVGRGKEV